MTNEQVAQVFDQIALLLQLEDESVFRIRSYERAAEAIRGLGEELATVRAGEGLESIPGVGEAIARKIEELLDTGELEYLNRLLAKYPEGFLEMLKVPGLGPKRAAMFYRELGIGSIHELEQAALAGRLRGLKGMGEKSEQKLLAAIESYWQGRERALLGEMLPQAEALVALLRELPAVRHADYAGSTRRGRETVGDLDLLATSDDPAQVCDRFAASGALAQVQLAGGTKVSGVLPGGRQVDLRVVAPDSYGAALMYFTGSQQHNIRLRERGQRMGLTLNEYGLFEIDEAGEPGARVAGETEDEVYAALELAFIPPELREDRGEIPAAEAGELPDLVELRDIRCDLHVHSTWSDGRASIEQMAQAVRERGHTHLGIADHSQALYVAGGLKPKDILRQREQVDALNARLADEGAKFTVLLGTEADILSDASLDMTDEVFAAVDFVVGAVHQGFSADADRMTGRIVQALHTGRIDILAHPTGRLLLGRDPYAVRVAEIIEAAIAQDVALEINAAPDRLDLSDVHARLAVDRGALLSINTDAHDLRHLDFLRYGVLTARRGWVTAPSVINTWPLRRLRSWLTRRRKRLA
ncbi:MAG: DNA polymerase/3'-5' exonuclease PolX [Armatimonadota bacterium]